MSHPCFSNWSDEESSTLADEWLESGGQQERGEPPEVLLLAGFQPWRFLSANCYRELAKQGFPRPPAASFFPSRGLSWPVGWCWRWWWWARHFPSDLKQIRSDYGSPLWYARQAPSLPCWILSLGLFLLMHLLYVLVFSLLIPAKKIKTNKSDDYCTW